MNKFTDGYITGLIEGRGVFNYRIDRNTQCFIFRIELPMVRRDTIKLLKEYFGLGNVCRYRKQIYYDVASFEDVPQIIKFMDKNYFMQTQNYVIYRMWRGIFLEYNMLRHVFDKQLLHTKHYNIKVFMNYAKQFKKLLRAKIVQPLSDVRYEK